MEPPGADGGELPWRRRGLAKIIAVRILVPPPAFDGAVAPHPAGVPVPGADGGELPGRRRGLADDIIAPAFDGAVASQPASVVPPDADGGELPGRGVASPAKSSPQHSTEPSVFTPQVCHDPALTEANSPDGGVASPYRFKSLQHSTEPSRLTPQV